MLGARFAARARQHTTLGSQRAILRAIGVAGVGPAGRPLALDVVERLAATHPPLLASGIALPFALAAYEYDLEPQQVALEIVAGHIDLSAEAALLSTRARSAPARALLDSWLAEADDRFDANAVARAELAVLLGEPRWPCIAIEEHAFDARDAAGRARNALRAGVDLVRVRIPRDGELRDDLGSIAPEDEWPVGPEAPAPTGSQRGLAMLRAALDEAGAIVGRSPGLAVRRVGLAAPEVAVVAGFERADVVFVDPIEAIEQAGIDVDRALADHAAADALLARTDVRLGLGCGSSIAEAGIGAADDADPGARDASASKRRAEAGGRALALQALSRAFAMHAGFPGDRLDLAACPPFAAQADRPLRALVEVALRTLLFPGHRLVIERDVADAVGPGLAGLLAACVSGGADLGIVFEADDGSWGGEAQRIGEAKALTAAAGAGRALGSSRSIGKLRGEALDMAVATLAEARHVLGEVERRGLAAIVGRGSGLGARGLVRGSDGDPGMAWVWGMQPARPGSARSRVASRSGHTGSTAAGDRGAGDPAAGDSLNR